MNQSARKFFWFKKHNNYGDILTPFICQELNIECEFAPLAAAQNLMVGSIAAIAQRGMKIYGSGFIRFNDKVVHGAKYIWVRGPLSRKKIVEAGLYAPELYGDAALLMPELLPAIRKKHDVGFIPHYVDFADNDMPGAKKISLTQGGIVGITQAIAECRSIVSSSLHGIIIAHAFGIPAAWVKLSDKLTGDGFKFYDHYQSVGLEAIKSTIDNPVFQVPTQIETKHIRQFLCSR